MESVVGMLYVWSIGMPNITWLEAYMSYDERFLHSRAKNQAEREISAMPKMPPHTVLWCVLVLKVNCEAAGGPKTSIDLMTFASTSHIFSAPKLVFIKAFTFRYKWSLTG